MRERLTDTALENLDAWLDVRRGAISVEVREALRMMLAELSSRRAADLTAFERMALRSHRDRLNANELEDRALVAALDKLLAAAEGK